MSGKMKGKVSMERILAIYDVDQVYASRFADFMNSREKLIVRMRYGLGSPDGREKTQKEVADMLGISQSYISRLEKRIMQRLRKEMARYE